MMRQYGLIGFPLSHSFSQKYFTEKFLRDGISDAEFINFSIPQIEELTEIFETHPQLRGLSVTIPYKQAVIKFLDEMDDAVTGISACNCIKIKNGKKTGYNTDIIGFERSFVKNLKSYHNKALVLGTGGASLAVQYVLKKLGIQYQIVSRKISENTISYNAVTHRILNQYNIVINCTPLGTFPDTLEAPLLPYNFLNKSNYLFDLVYNPPVTRFLEYGTEKECTIQNGYEMLVIQAEENWKIWNS